MVFEKLEKRLILKGVIETVTPLHIGSGRPEIDIGEVDMPVLRAPGGEPYIPGSSFKGRTRAEAERITKSKGWEVCNPPNVREMCGSRHRNPDDFCIACRIFGSTGDVSVASKVKFRDAYPVDGVEEMLERTGTAIDRRTGTVARGALYSIEAIPAGASFNLVIVAENLAEDELKLLKAALKSVEDSALGGGSSRGFGKIKLDFQRLEERTPGYYLGEEAETVLEDEDLDRWLQA